MNFSRKGFVPDPHLHSHFITSHFPQQKHSYVYHIISNGATERIRRFLLLARLCSRSRRSISKTQPGTLPSLIVRVLINRAASKMMNYYPLLRPVQTQKKHTAYDFKNLLEMLFEKEDSLVMTVQVPEKPLTG